MALNEKGQELFLEKWNKKQKRIQLDPEHINKRTRGTARKELARTTTFLTAMQTHSSQTDDYLIYHHRTFIQQ